MKTSLCDILGTEYPIILAGMGTAGGYTLTAAVSNAGGLGMLGGTELDPEELRDWIRKIRKLTDKPFGVDILFPSAVPAKVDTHFFKEQIPERHVQFVNKLKKDFGIEHVTARPWPMTEEYGRKQFQVVKEEKVPFFALGLGTPEWLIPEAHEAGIKIISLVGNVRNAIRMKQRGADIIVAQGYDAGGHTGKIGTLVLIPQVVDAVYPTPVVAAGGIGDGRGLVAVLALGAVGAWIGTAFLATKEAFVDFIDIGMYKQSTCDAFKRQIVEANEESAQISRSYTGKTARMLKNKWTELWEQSNINALPMPFQTMLIGDLMKGFMEIDQTDYLANFAGQVAGMIKEIKSSQEVMEGIVKQATNILTNKFTKEISLETK